MTPYCGNRIFDARTYPADRLCGKGATFIVRGNRNPPEVILYLCADCRVGWKDGRETTIVELSA